MAVQVSTTYTITPENKTIAGYITALTMLKEAGAPVDTAVLITENGGISITIADHEVRNAIRVWAGGIGDVIPGKPIEPVAV